MFIGTELEKYQELARRLTPDEFSSQCEGYYLFVDTSSNTPVGELDYYTGIIRTEPPGANGAPPTNPRREAMKPGLFLIKLTKKPDSPWSRWYSVGRANNADVVLRHPSVSKLHARIHRPDPMDPSNDLTDSLSITDMGSTKGTTLNRERLIPSTRYPLQIGDKVTFGDVQTIFFDAQMLYSHLAAMVDVVD